MTQPNDPKLVTIINLVLFMQTVRYLVSIPIIKAKINALNAAIDLLEHRPRDFKSLAIEIMLMKITANYRVEEDHPNITTNTLGIQSPNVDAIKPVLKSSSWLTHQQLSSTWVKYMNHQSNWVEEMQAGFADAGGDFDRRPPFLSKLLSTHQVVFGIKIKVNFAQQEPLF